MSLISHIGNSTVVDNINVPRHGRLPYRILADSVLPTSDSPFDWTRTADGVSSDTAGKPTR